MRAGRGHTRAEDETCRPSSSGRPAQPPAQPGLHRIRPGPWFRHRPGPGPHAHGQARRRAPRSIHPLVDVRGRELDLQAAGRSRATVRSYGMDLLRWFRFLWAVRSGVQGRAMAHAAMSPSTRETCPAPVAARRSRRRTASFRSGPGQLAMRERAMRATQGRPSTRRRMAETMDVSARNTRPAASSVVAWWTSSAWRWSARRCSP